MEYSDFGSLLDLVLKIKKPEESISMNLVRFLSKGILKGLQVLHSEKNFAHLDIKHDNILLDKDLNPKLADFGFTLNASS